MSLLERLGFKPTLPRFAARIMKALPPAAADGWSYSPDRCALRHVGGAEMALQNMFMAYCRAPVRDRAALVQRYAALANAEATEIPALWEAAARKIFPVLRSEFAETTVEIHARAQGARHDPVVIPLAGDLQIRLVYDFGDYVGYVRGDLLETWNQPLDAVLARAIANLGALPAPQWQDEGNGVFRARTDESFAESMLLLGSVTRHLPFAADAVFMPCARGVLLAADGFSEPAVAAMLAEAERCLEQAPWPISGRMFAKRSTGWETVTAPAALAELAHGLEVRHLAQTYAAQKDALDAVNVARGEEVYVAEFGMTRKGGAWECYGVWSEGFPILLPQTDWVAVLPQGEEATHIAVAWRDLVEICGAHLQATPERPPRFLVDSFPTEAEWTRLEARAIK